MNVIQALRVGRRQLRWTWAFGVLLLALLVVAAWGSVRAPTTRAPDPLAQATSLVTADVVCAYRDEQARQVAMQRSVLAHHRWERAVFEPTLAPLALSDAQMAVACYRASHDVQSADQAERVASEMQRQVQREQARARLQLTIAINRRDAAAQLKAIAALRSGASHKPVTYRAWLDRLERNARAELGR